MTNEQLAILIGEWEHQLTGSIGQFGDIELEDIPEKHRVAYNTGIQLLDTLSGDLQTAIRVLLGKEQSYRPGR